MLLHVIKLTLNPSLNPFANGERDFKNKAKSPLLFEREGRQTSLDSDEGREMC